MADEGWLREGTGIAVEILEEGLLSEAGWRRRVPRPVEVAATGADAQGRAPAFLRKPG
jgi:hypothetical protein